MEIEESGGAAWSTTPGSPLRGRAGFEMVVRVAAGPYQMSLSRLDALVAAARPAHVVHRVEMR